MKRFVIGQNDAGQRVDSFIRKATPSDPQSMISKAKRKKDIKLNRKRFEISTRLNEGDILELYLNDCFFSSDITSDSDSYDFMSSSKDISIVYEDENVILLNKEVGLVVHEDESGDSDTLVNRLKRYLYEKGEYSPQNENSFVPALCNRIDRNTCGIVIAAKNAESLRVLNDKIKNREIDKRYLCITVGIPPKKADTMTAYIFKNSKTNTVTVSDKKTSSNRTAITSYRVLKTYDNLSLCEVELKTGRTHQIRAHMSYIGCPLLGDSKYGNNEANRKYKVKKQALCSYKLRFAFNTSASILEYLNGKEFTVDNIWFLNEFIQFKGR